MVKLRKPIKITDGDVEFLFIAQYEAEHGVLLRVHICLHILLYWLNMVLSQVLIIFKKLM